MVYSGFAAWDFTVSSLLHSSCISSATPSVASVFEEVETRKRAFPNTASQVASLGATVCPLGGPPALHRVVAWMSTECRALRVSGYLSASAAPSQRKRACNPLAVSQGPGWFFWFWLVTRVMGLGCWVLWVCFMFFFLGGEAEGLVSNDLMAVSVCFLLRLPVPSCSRGVSDHCRFGLWRASSRIRFWSFPFFHDVRGSYVCLESRYCVLAMMESAVSRSLFTVFSAVFVESQVWLTCFRCVLFRISCAHRLGLSYALPDLKDPFGFSETTMSFLESFWVQTLRATLACVFPIYTAVRGNSAVHGVSWYCCQLSWVAIGPRGVPWRANLVLRTS